MSPRQPARLAMLLLMVVIFSACQPPPTATPTPDTGEYPVKIFDTTKVSDQTTRNALKGFDSETGTMRFAQSTEVLNNLKANDVMVSEPSSVAPFGYLRRVKTVRKEGNEVVLETEPAKLTDAVQSGTLKIEASAPELTETGFSTRDLRPKLGVGVGIGKGFVYNETFSETICLDDSNCDAGNIKIDGKVRVSLGFRVQLGVDYEFPSSFMAYFEASAGGDSSADFNVAGAFKDAFKKEKRIGDYYDVITGSIGPVPVVIVVNSELWVGVDGSAQGNFTVGASPTLSALVGLRWTSKDGFKFFPGPQAALNFRPPNLSASTKVHAYTRTEVRLKLYGLFGPTIMASGGAELEAAFPRDPLWTVSGRAFGRLELAGKIPIIDVPFDLSQTLFDEKFKVGDAPILPPVLTITKSSLEVIYKKPTDFYGYFTVADPQGRTVTLSGSSSRDGTLPTLNHAFASPGPRTLTLTASNGDKASQGQINIDAINHPPSVQGAGNNASTPLGLPLFLNANGYDLNEPQNRLDCSKLRWTASGSDVVTTETGSSFGCQPKISFSEQGSRSLNVTATDPEGLSAIQSVTVNVSARPAQLPPIVDRIEISKDGEKLQNNQEVFLSTGLNIAVPVDNPDNSPVNFAWSVEQVPRPEDCAAANCSIFFNPRRVLNFNQNQASFDWIPSIASMPGFKFPTEKRCIAVFGQPNCEFQNVEVAARVVVLLTVTSSVAPDIAQIRSFNLQISPKTLPPK